MPLGISERKIERAYGPMDLSGVYKPILATAQKIYADEVKRIDEAKKQLATTSAELNKLRAGVREADLPDITRMYNRWAEVERQLANNPNLIRRNPDVYGELKNESNTLYGNMLGVIKESKQQSDYELNNIKLMSDPNNLNKFRENALSDYQSRVLKTPISVLRTSRDNDITTYYNPLIDASKFYENFKKDAKGSLKDRNIPGTTPDKFGQLTPTLLKGMPNQDVLFEIARSDIKTYSNNKPHILAEQQLELMPKEEKQSIIDRYNQFYDSGEYQKYGLPKEKVFNFSAPKINKVQEFAELMAAEQFLANKPIPELGKTDFPSKAAELQFRQNLKDISERGAKADANKGFLDAYTTIKERLARFPGGVSLDKYDIATQGVVIDMVKGIGLDANNRDIYLKENRDTGEVDILTMKEFSYNDGSNKVVVYNKNEKIGKLNEAGINLFANKSLGMEAKKEAAAGGTRGRLVPPKKMN